MENYMKPIDYDYFSNYWLNQQKSAKHMPKDDVLTHIKNFINNHNCFAFASGCDNFVRCTPIEYTYMNDKFYFFSEGGQKFKALKENKNVSMAIYEYHGDLNDSHGLQITGEASVYSSDEDLFKEVLDYMHIPFDAIKALNVPTVLIEVCVKEYEMYDTDFVKNGYDVRQIITF